MTAVWWIRRDLRACDNPAAVAAAAAGDVLPLFVVDPAIYSPGRPRDAWLATNVLALESALGRPVCLRIGDPAEIVPRTVQASGAREVHVTTESGPHGRRRDDQVKAALSALSVPMIETGTPYATPPGTVVKTDGTPFKVFGPFERAWRRAGWPEPTAPPETVTWAADPDRQESERVRDMLDSDIRACTVELPEPGEIAASRTWASFRATHLDDYATRRDLPALDATSRLSPYLKVGAIHPRTLLADIRHDSRDGAVKFGAELAWREFYADVLARHPESAASDLTESLAGMSYDSPGDGFDAWRRGETGFPLVDAGMRQLLREGRMHNRVRMIAASFLTKDLHVWWPHGARHFMDHLIDGDPASNSHGWQWVAGTGTDAAPYFRVFNPMTQAERFDPNGEYVRRYIPELRHLSGKSALTPWNRHDGHAHGYPLRLVDHAEERLVAIDRYRGRR